jgi:hypothetical protein
MLALQHPQYSQHLGFGNEDVWTRLANATSATMQLSSTRLGTSKGRFSYRGTLSWDVDLLADNTCMRPGVVVRSLSRPKVQR